MKKHLFWLVLFISMSHHPVAQAVDVTGKTYALKGDIDGRISAICRPSFSREDLFASIFPINTQRTLRANITFNTGNGFNWSEKGLKPSLNNVTGIWGAIDNDKNILRFDDEGLSRIQSLPQLIVQKLDNQGINSQIKRIRYGFSAKTSLNGNKLTVTESGRYRIRATGLSNGSKVACTLFVKVKRVYQGDSVLQ
ncbi:hypothetical protein MCAMS1_01726 [biofilm metagenome]